MANSKYEAEVVRYLRKKTNGGYTEAPTYLGSEQKFVGALRNSNDNNLEEQFLLGTDCLTTEWKDNGNSYIKKEYFIQDTGDDATQKLSSYVVNTVIYGPDNVHNTDCYFTDDALVADNMQDIAFNSDVLVLDDDQVYCYSMETLQIYPNAFVITREAKLQFVDSTNTLIDVLTKYTGRKYSKDGKYSYVQEKIINHIK